MPAHSRTRRRSRRILLTIAATTLVVIAPTAWNHAAGPIDEPTGSGSPVGSGLDDHSGHPGHSDHGGAPTASGVRTVPVGAVSELDPQQTPEDPGYGTEPTADAAATSTVGESVPPPTSTPETSTPETSTPESGTAETGTPGSGPFAAAPPAAPGLEILGDDCTSSDLEPHDGFQNAPRCVAIAFGEVAAQDRSPSLLITGSPDTVAPGQPFTLEVSTRNLVRDRFLGAAAGGYYRESSFLNADGIQRGHFHTACRLLPSLDEAPDAAPAPAFFLATQDGGGGPGVDTVEVPVTGIADSGELQCTVWAGDGSHRVPMMQRANQTPAFDAVRITVE